ncbi:MAG: CsbD family protein [Desulfuromonadales bacterium]|nr:CsbD family protein [Desulfuromonadales bacterium]
MRTSRKFIAKGIFHELRGTVKEFAGKISSNTRLGVDGKFERFAGKFQRKLGKAQGVFGF